MSLSDGAAILDFTNVLLSVPQMVSYCFCGQCLCLSWTFSRCPLYVSQTRENRTTHFKSTRQYRNANLNPQKDHLKSKKDTTERLKNTMLVLTTFTCSGILFRLSLSDGVGGEERAHSFEHQVLFQIFLNIRETLVFVRCFVVCAWR